MLDLKDRDRWHDAGISEAAALRLRDNQAATAALLEAGSPAARFVTQFTSERLGRFGLPTLLAAMEITEQKCEIDKLAREIDGADLLDDFSSNVWSCSTAGFPCQPFSMAGKRKGADDDRYLWPETIRVIKEVRPAWFVGENVFGIASMVLPSEEVDMGRTDDLFEEAHLYRKEQQYVLDRICQDIEDAGYTVQPVVIPACAVGAPHRRDRVWFVARRKDAGYDAEDPDRHGREDRVAEERTEEREQRVSGAGARGRLRGDLADPARREREAPGEGFGGEGAGERVVSQSAERGESQIPRFQGWEGFPTQPPVCRGDDGLPFGVADLSIPFGRWRREALKALGNAWVPEVAYEIFRMIQEVENGTDEQQD